MTYHFDEGDQVVIRLDASNDQRMGVVESVDGAGAAVIKLWKGGRIKILPSGESHARMFTLIKHVPVAEYNASRRCGV